MAGGVGAGVGRGGSAGDGFDPLPPPPLTVAGVDVVDLGDPRCPGKASDRRFVGRVLADEEQRALEAAPDPDLHLWLLWSGKEAAFKALSRREGAPPVFRHRDFVVRVEGESPGTPLVPGRPSGGRRVLEGRCRWAGRRARIRWELAGRRILALALEGGDPSTGLRVGAADIGGAEPRVPRERCSVEVRRHAAEEVARALDVSPSRVAIATAAGPAGRSPPLALLDGRPAPVEVSLSHHGRWIAWAALPHPTIRP